MLDPSVIDNLRQLNREGEPDVVHEVMTLFLDDAPKHLSLIDAAVVKADAPGLQRAAHALKGASASIGATALQAACRELEDLSRSGTLDGAKAVVARVRDEFARVKAEINQLI